MPAPTKTYEITREIEEALAQVRRGADELLVEPEFAQKMARAAAEGGRCASSSAWTRPRPTCTSATRSC